MPSPRFPDLLCIGAQRSGTTWLWNNLTCCPSVYAPPYKELSFFDQRTVVPRPATQKARQMALEGVLNASRDGRLSDPMLVQWFRRFALARRNDDAWYTSLFMEAEPDALAIDFSPSYARMDAAQVARAAERIPEGRVVMLLRDPIDRAWSQLHLLRKLGRPPGVRTPADFQRWCQSPEVSDNHQYQVILDRWSTVFGEDRLFVGYYEEVQSRPLELLTRLMDWLECPFDPTWVTESQSTVYNRHVYEAIPTDFARAAAPVVLTGLVPLAQRRGGPPADWLERCLGLLGMTR